MPATSANFNSPVPFVLAMQMGMTWTINGRVYDPMECRPG